MPTLTAPTLVWYQCQVCRATISKRKPVPAEAGLDKAVRHVREVHSIAYPDSLALVTEHRPKP